MFCAPRLANSCPWIGIPIRRSGVTLSLRLDHHSHFRWWLAGAQVPPDCVSGRRCGSIRCMSFSWEDSRTAFADAAGWFVRTVALVGDRWDQPALGEWDVRALTGHTSRSLMTVETSHVPRRPLTSPLLPTTSRRRAVLLPLQLWPPAGATLRPLWEAIPRPPWRRPPNAWWRSSIEDRH